MKNKQAKVLALLEKGLKPKEIAIKAKCTSAYVYKINADRKIDKEIKEKNDKADLQYKIHSLMRGRPRKSSPSDDVVNHPAHYKSGGIETIDFIEAKNLDYHLGNVVKYVSRAGLKGDKKQDLQKAQWYLNRAISLIK